MNFMFEWQEQYRTSERSEKKTGEEYEPSSLRAFIQSSDRHLRKNNYRFSVLNDKEFHEVQDI